MGGCARRTTDILHTTGHMLLMPGWRLRCLTLSDPRPHSKRIVGGCARRTRAAPRSSSLRFPGLRAIKTENSSNQVLTHAKGPGQGNPGQGNRARSLHLLRSEDLLEDSLEDLRIDVVNQENRFARTVDGYHPSKFEI